MAESNMIPGGAWLSLPLEAWSEPMRPFICGHRSSAIRLAQTPWTNHSWHVTLYVTARGSRPARFHTARARFKSTSTLSLTRSRSSATTAAPRVFLEPQSVAVFYRRLKEEMTKLDLEVKINHKPNEVANAIPFDQDEAHAGLRPGVRQPLLARAVAKRPRS